ncbi:MAG: NADH-quinone oxidoreductase subunit NuoH [Anaerolineae bacterium]|nr:NADH-quinone oxidoreductase subunit NuoH [Anaerolineae bacterium]
MIETLTNLGWNPHVATFVALALGAVAAASFGLVWIIFSIWLERKVAGRIQRRLGPNRTGPWGLFQTFADVGKLLTKEDITPAGADRHVYNIAPILAVASIVLIWAVVPFSASWIGADLNVGVLYFVAVGSLATLAVLLAGWGSNNKYALLGAFRVIAALVSYEIPMVLALVIPVLLAGTMSTMGIVQSQGIAYAFVVPLSAFIFFISSVAEVGRSPFDLIEAESEIVAGFNIEYSGMKFAMFYAAEFLHAFTICVLTAIMFFGGWQGLAAAQPGYEILGFVQLMAKSILLYFIVMLMRSTFPRLRIDHMMAFNWKFLVPLALVNLVVIGFLARFFVPDYAWAEQAVAAGGLASFAAGVFGTAFVAEFPRAVALVIANVLMAAVAIRLLHSYADRERAKLQAMTRYRPAGTAYPAEPSVEPSTAPAGR